MALTFGHFVFEIGVRTDRHKYTETDILITILRTPGGKVTTVGCLTFNIVHRVQEKVVHYIFICTIAIVYSTGQIIKPLCVCASVCVYLSVCAHSHGRIS